MNISLFRIAAVIAGAIGCAVIFFLMKPMLDILHSVLPAASAPESAGWRAAVTASNIAVCFVIYALLGIAFGYARPQSKWKWGLWVAFFPILLAVVMLMFAGIEYPSTLIFGVLACIVGGSLGAQIGAHFKQKPVGASDV